jgi:hypothetical protein
MLLKGWEALRAFNPAERSFYATNFGDMIGLS